MIVVNETKEVVIAKHVRAAENFFERFRGLIGSPPLAENEGFLIPSCQGIHTFGMSYAIDALYLDRDGKVLEVINALKPNSFGIVNFKSHSVLELPAGTIEQTKTEKGDLLFIADVSSFSIVSKPRNKILSFLPPIPRML